MSSGGGGAGNVPLSLAYLKPERLGLSDFLGMAEATESKASVSKGKCRIRVVNRQLHPVQFTIKCDAPQYYRVNFSKGTIKPQAQFPIEIECTMDDPLKLKDVLPHTFLVTIFYQELLVNRTLTILDDSQILRRRLSVSKPAEPDVVADGSAGGKTSVESNTAPQPHLIRKNSAEEEQLLAALNGNQRKLPPRLWPVGFCAVLVFVLTALIFKSDAGSLLKVWIAFALGAASMLWAFNLQGKSRLKYS
eukprot:TRINITY_DN59203_c0_g1_i1.p1 TRINITY_DN59203_c0_g1~~TRINITY_DN59203_c0_g1_i1.p1  ORF type:complete len:248 (+),score=61.03 TRINITY_DN59203_c0_g1_i1:95-838(+)